MATLAPGVLLKMMNGMSTGSKATGSHRNALLQVTDILPVDLDEKALWPKHGFYIKISDSSHSIYASLPVEQDDLVLSNKIQLGQFIYVKKLLPGSPVPVVYGAKPLPGRHPLVGTPEPITRLRSKGDRGTMSKTLTRRRGSWGPDDNLSEEASPIMVMKPLDFEISTPLKERNESFHAGKLHSSPLRGGKLGMEGSSSAMAFRCSVSGFLSRTADLKTESPLSVRKSCAALSSSTKMPRSKSVSDQGEKFSRTPLNTSVDEFQFAFVQGKKSTMAPSTPTTTPSGMRYPRGAGISVSLSGETPNVFTPNACIAKSQSQPEKTTSKSIFKLSTSSNPAPKRVVSRLGGFSVKLSTIGREVIQQRETSQRIALQALRDASASESLVRVLKMLTELIASGDPEFPAACFDQFLNFHSELVQAVSDMESIQAASTVLCQSPKQGPETNSSLLQEIEVNALAQHDTSSMGMAKRRYGLSKSASVAPDKGQSKVASGEGVCEGKEIYEIGTLADQKQQPVSRSSAFGSNLIKLGKQLDTEAGNWFMDFLVEVMESGLRKRRESSGDASKTSCCSQSLLLRVINWVEVEQSDPNKRPIHPRAGQIARRLRIKMKNP